MCGCKLVVSNEVQTKVGAGRSGNNAKGYNSGIAGARNWAVWGCMGSSVVGDYLEGVEVEQRADGCFEAGSCRASEQEEIGRSQGQKKKKAGRERE